MNDTKRNVGDVVGADGRPGRWEIVKINPKSIEVKPLDGQSNRNLKTYPWMLTDAPPAIPTGEPSIGTPYVERTYFDPGAVVTCRVPKLVGKLLVVTADRGKDRVTCSELFGAIGWHIPRVTLTAVAPNELVATLLSRIANQANLGTDERAHVKAVRELLADSEIARMLKNKS